MLLSTLSLELIFSVNKISSWLRVILHIKLLSYFSILETNTQEGITGTSFLQIKYVAEDYFDGHERGHLQDGDEKNKVLAPMKDIPLSGYTAVVGVGTPPQKLDCIFDTGSSVMFVK